MASRLGYWFYYRLQNEKSWRLRRIKVILLAVDFLFRAFKILSVKLIEF